MNPQRHEQAQIILAAAFHEIRQLGLAPVFKWARPAGEPGDPHKMAAHISDFIGFHELHPLDI